jgi:hypothetical protein
MSTVNTPTQSPVAKKTRAPVLSEKLSKFIQFGYFMMSQMSDSDSFTKDEYMEKLQMFAPVEEQDSFVQGFLDGKKETKKNMNKMVRDKKNENKPKKQRTPRAPRKAKETGVTELTQSDLSDPVVRNLSIELSEEPMIEQTTETSAPEEIREQINAAVEVAKELTAKKPRVKKADSEKKPRVKKAVKKSDPVNTETESQVVN